MAAALRRVLSRGLEAAPGQEDGPGPPVLLLGAAGSGKTALLFAAALEAAGDGRGHVLFLTRRPLQSLPRGTTGAAREPWRLQKIRFQYPPSTQELVWLLCSAHEGRGPAPSLLLLDGLEEYLAEDPGTQEVAHLAALLLDTAAHFGQRLGPGRECGLAVALQTPEEGDGTDALQLAVLQRYLPAQCWLQPQAPRPGREPSCLRACLDPGAPGPRSEWTVMFGEDGEMTVTPWCSSTQP